MTKRLLEYEKHYTRAGIRANPNKIYVFGDNLEERGYGGQAAAARDEPNTIGIPTKRSPYVYLTDADFWDMVPIYQARFQMLHRALADGKTIVWPSDGIGTGRANLAHKSPQCWKLLQLFITDFMSDIESMEKEQANV